MLFRMGTFADVVTSLHFVVGYWEYRYPHQKNFESVDAYRKKLSITTI